MTLSKGVAPVIFLDLDECLIHSIFGASNNKRRKKINLGIREDGRKDIYSSLPRVGLHTILDNCRELAPTRMLTTATRDYALAHNEIFKMGFDPRDIIAREDFLFESPTAYGGTTRTVTAVKTCPHSVLIDNLPPHEESPQLKQLFLGIKEHQYFQIREFYGAPDPECFPEELATLIKTVNKKLEELAKSPDKEINKMSPACQTTPPQQLQTYPSL